MLQGYLIINLGLIPSEEDGKPPQKSVSYNINGDIPVSDLLDMLQITQKDITIKLLSKKEEPEPGLKGAKKVKGKKEVSDGSKEVVQQ